MEKGKGEEPRAVRCLKSYKVGAVTLDSQQQDLIKLLDSYRSWRNDAYV